MVLGALLVLLGLAGRPMPATGAFLKSAPLAEILIATGFLALTSMALGLLFSAMTNTPEKTMPLLLVAVVVQIILSGGVFTVNGKVGAEQLAWLADDVKGLSASTPIVVFAHIPLWTIYKDWGWGTEDAAQALSTLKRFGSLTVLNGHIHQIIQKVEGNVAFHTALSTGFPQPAPGAAPAPTPLAVPAEKLRSVLGIRSVSYVQGKEVLATIDQPLASA